MKEKLIGKGFQQGTRGICNYFMQWWQKSHRKEEGALPFVRIDVKLAMKALAQKKKGHAVHVKVVSAPGAPGESRHCCEDTEKYHPNHKNRGRNVERSCQTESRPHYRQVGKDDYPQKPTALPNFSQARA